MCVSSRCCRLVQQALEAAQQSLGQAWQVPRACRIALCSDGSGAASASHGHDKRTGALLLPIGQAGAAAVGGMGMGQQFADDLECGLAVLARPGAARPANDSVGSASSMLLRLLAGTVAAAQVHVPPVDSTSSSSPSPAGSAAGCSGGDGSSTWPPLGERQAASACPSQPQLAAAVVLDLVLPHDFVSNGSGEALWGWARLRHALYASVGLQVCALSERGLYALQADGEKRGTYVGSVLAGMGHMQ